jgi:hypothetical protein
MKKYQYQIISYVHDHFTGEYVNIGAVVYAKDQSFLKSKITSKTRRIKDMFPDADKYKILEVLRCFERRLVSKADELNGIFNDLPNQLDQITSQIIVEDGNAIRFSKVSVGVDIDLDHALNDLFESQVDKYNTSKNEGSLSDTDVWKKYKVYFDQHSIESRLVEHKVEIPQDEIVFDKAWKNNIWHCYEPVSFTLQEKSSIKDKVYKWAGKLQGLKQASEPLHIALLTTITPEHHDLIPFIEKYLKINDGTLEVDIITEDKAEAFVKKVKEDIHFHDSQ